MKRNLLLSVLILSSLSITSCGKDENSENSQPSANSNTQESINHSEMPSVTPSASESVTPSVTPSVEPSTEPSLTPSEQPSEEPSVEPSVEPSETTPSETESEEPTIETISIAKAIEIASSLPVGKDKTGDHITTSQYTVSGTLIVDGNNYSLTDGTDTIKLYYFINNEDRNLIHDGYAVTVTGYLENYGFNEGEGTPEIVNFTVDTYTAVTYTVTIPTFENGTITGVTENIAYGTETTYTVTPSTGYKVEWVKFNNTSVDASTGTFTVKVEKNSEITASFVSEETAVATMVEFNFAKFAVENKWEDKTKYTEFSSKEVTVTCSDGTNTGKYYSSNQTWRIYSSDAASITITLAEGFEFESVTFTYASGAFEKYANGEEVATTGTTITLTATEKTFITSIIVKYNPTKN